MVTRQIQLSCCVIIRNTTLSTAKLPECSISVAKLDFHISMISMTAHFAGILQAHRNLNIAFNLNIYHDNFVKTPTNSIFKCDVLLVLHIICNIVIFDNSMAPCLSLR